MKGGNPLFRPPIAILGKGEYPRHPLALQALKDANTLICTDGSADHALQRGLQPQVIIGDLDSTSLDEKTFHGIILHRPDQEETDMAKALHWCHENGLSPVTVLGASGMREDQTLANLHLLAEFCEILSLKLLTNYFTITCHRGKQTFPSFRGQVVSIFPLNPNRRVLTSGLQYSLTAQPLLSLSQGVSNQAEGGSFTVDCPGRVWVFRSHPQD